MVGGTVALLLCADITALRFRGASAKCRCFDFSAIFMHGIKPVGVCVCVLLFIIFNEASLIMRPGLCHWSPGVDWHAAHLQRCSADFKRSERHLRTDSGFERFPKQRGGKTRGASIWFDWDGITLSVKLIDFSLCFFFFFLSWWSPSYVDVSRMWATAVDPIEKWRTHT